MKRSGVRPSLSVPSFARYSGFAAVGPAGVRYGLIAGLTAAARCTAADASSGAFTAAVGGWTQTR